jgi:hypothetical protein
MNAPLKLRNIGPKSAAWLRQVGLRTEEDLRAIGALEAFMRVKRAGFKPSLNLLYALEGALLGCHWQEVPAERRSELLVAADAAIALLPPPRRSPPPTWRARKPPRPSACSTNPTAATESASRSDRLHCARFAVIRGRSSED